MDYDAVLAQVLELLQREQRVAYRILKRRLQLDDETLEDLKDDLIYAKKLAVDERRPRARLDGWDVQRTANRLSRAAACHAGRCSSAGRGRRSRSSHARSRTSATHGDVLRPRGFHKTLLPARSRRVPGRGACVSKRLYGRDSPL